MMDEPERARVRDWLWAIVREPLFWPLPAALFLALVLPFASAGVWLSTSEGRRETWSPAELAMVMTGMGTGLYWLTMFMARAGLLNASPRRGMREPSGAELRVVELGLRVMCLLMTYAGPAIVLFAP